MVTVSDLLKIAGHNSPNATTTAIADAVNKYAAHYDVTTSKRLSQFLANVSIETGGFRSLEESLNYSVEGLLSEFGRHRISEADAKRLGRTLTRKADQRAIANILYGGAWGKENLGNTQPNDGWDFRGSGPGQLTGRDNFASASKVVGIDLVASPDAMRTADVGAHAALAMWKARGLNERADRSETTAIRKIWNGGTKGLLEVTKAYSRARMLPLSVPAAPPVAPIAMPQPPAPTAPAPAQSIWSTLASLWPARK